MAFEVKITFALYKNDRNLYTKRCSLTQSHRIAHQRLYESLLVYFTLMLNAYNIRINVKITSWQWNKVRTDAPGQHIFAIINSSIFNPKKRQGDVSNKNKKQESLQSNIRRLRSLFLCVYIHIILWNNAGKKNERERWSAALVLQGVQKLSTSGYNFLIRGLDIACVRYRLW